MPLQDQLSEFTYLYFHLYSHYIKIYIHIFVKFRTFHFILKKSNTVAADFDFNSDYMNSYVCRSHSQSMYAVLTSMWCLDMNHDHSSPVTNLSRKNTKQDQDHTIITHFIVGY
jgi:hypothetical protein